MVVEDILEKVMSDRTVNINKLSNNTLAVSEDASLVVSTVPFIVCVCAPSSRNCHRHSKT